MKYLALTRISILFCLFAVLISSSSCFYRVVGSQPQREVVYNTPPPAQVIYTPPVWAPPYDNAQQVRYYYLPDMQCYYDVYMQQYVYNDGFQWIHSGYAPAAYSGYDMNTGYVVVLSAGVTNPWVNHTNYVTNYPRGYYNSPAYSNGQINGGNGNSYGPRRGYNENDKSTLYHGNRNGGTQAQPNMNGGNQAQPNRNNEGQMNERQNPGNNNPQERNEGQRVNPNNVQPGYENNREKPAPNENNINRENNNNSNQYRNNPTPVENKQPERPFNQPKENTQPKENRNNQQQQIQPRNNPPQPNNQKQAPPAKKSPKNQPPEKEKKK